MQNTQILPLARGSWVMLLLALGCTHNASQPNAPGPSMMIIEETALRMAPSDAMTIPDPRGAPQPVNNYVGQLSRGKAGFIVERGPDWTRVVLEDDAKGWVRSVAVLPMRGVSEATVLQATPVFPTAGGATAAAMAMPGALLFVQGAQGKQSKVQMETVGTVWIDTQALITEPQEISMSHLLIDARTSTRLGDVVQAVDVFDDAKRRFPTSPLLNVMAAQVHATWENAPR